MNMELPELEKVKEKIKNDDILKDMNDFADTSSTLPRFSASTMTNHQLIEVIQFMTDEIKRLNIKVWNLLRLEQERVKLDQ